MCKEKQNKKLPPATEKLMTINLTMKQLAKFTWYLAIIVKAIKFMLG